MFKVGDRIKCVSNYDYDSEFLVEDKTYIVTEVNQVSNCLKVKGAYSFWYQTRFVLDIKYLRKQKLNKIYESVR